MTASAPTLWQRVTGRAPLPAGPAAPMTAVPAASTAPRRGGRTEPLPFLEPVTMPDALRRATHMAASLLLDYPGPDHDARLDAVEITAESLPAIIGDDLRAHIQTIREWGIDRTQEYYVETFDQKRRCALHLTYYSSGDTRRRGMALVTFTEAFAACGWELGDDDLPDFLPTVLELSARDGGPVVDMLLATHREGIELLRSALHHVRSPYRFVLDALCRTLPHVDDAAAARFVDLLAAGPPQEMVGIGGTLLPFPSVRPEATP
ncbi:nitrate reductase molybdenum cofactor assembly chaperone [Sanguibacter sp. A247]|uniref:nitrate reductase molybdenum cofactor assembly chaperone n=1 Tax=unclassified Sanguibacter TaxID=2645534 RepID=UPI003FD7284C